MFEKFKRKFPHLYSIPCKRKKKSWKQDPKEQYAILFIIIIWKHIDIQFRLPFVSIATFPEFMKMVIKEDFTTSNRFPDVMA